MFKKFNYIQKELSKKETIIGSLLKVEGNFIGEGNVIIEGEIKGSLETKNDIRIGEKARVRANIKAENVFVNGEVRGNIKAQGKVELTKGAKVLGDIETKILSLSEGAIFNGKCLMLEESKPEKNQTNSK